MECQVCGHHNGKPHFGVISCKACSAFFRRCCALKKKYRCHANGHCEITPNGRKICRGCRQERCNRIGMKPEKIQYNRDPLGSKSERRALSNYSSMGQDSSAWEGSQTGTRLELINRMIHNYRLLEHRRDLLYRKRQTSKPRGRALNFKEVNRSCMEECALRAEWVVATFPVFKTFTYREKKQMFSNFFAANTILYFGYLCSKYDRTDLIIFPNTGNYLNIVDIETIYKEDEERASKEAARIFAPSFDIYRRNVFQPMQQFKFNETEFVVLAALTLFETAISGQSAECEDQCRRTRELIIQELIEYYLRVKRIKEPEQRLLHLMLMLPALQRCVDRTVEDLRIGRLFEICPNDYSFFDPILMKL